MLRADLQERPCPGCCPEVQSSISDRAASDREQHRGLGHRGVFRAHQEPEICAGDDRVSAVCTAELFSCCLDE